MRNLPSLGAGSVMLYPCLFLALDRERSLQSLRVIKSGKMWTRRDDKVEDDNFIVELSHLGYVDFVRRAALQ